MSRGQKNLQDRVSDTVTNRFLDSKVSQFMNVESMQNPHVINHDAEEANHTSREMYVLEGANRRYGFTGHNKALTQGEKDQKYITAIKDELKSYYVGIKEAQSNNRPEEAKEFAENLSIGTELQREVIAEYLSSSASNTPEKSPEDDNNGGGDNHGGDDSSSSDGGGE